MAKKLLLLVILVSANFIESYTQEENTSIMLGWFPQLMAARGLRVDVDIHLGKSKSWLSISPQYFLEKRSGNTYDDTFDSYNWRNSYKNMEGYGLAVSHRIYMSNSNQPIGFYLGYGAFFNHFNITYEDYSWGEIEYLDIEAIGYGLFEHETVVNKAGPDIFIGYQTSFIDRIVLDFFCGGGIRYSFIKTSELSPRYFNDDFMKFGYTGTVPLVGMRIGILL